MTDLKHFKIIHIALVAINSIVFFLSKKPMHGVSSNAAGGLIFIAGIILMTMIIHLILLVVAWYYKKTWLLKVLAFIMVPGSIFFWYIIF